MLFKSKSLSVSVMAVLLLLCAYFLYAKSAVVKIADAEYTYHDIEKNLHVEEMIVKVIGGQTISRSDVLYNLSVAAIQKQLLLNNQVDMKEQEMIELLEQTTPFKGLYNSIEQYLGDDYFRLFIEPIAVNQLAQSLFGNNNPRRSAAAAFHQQALAEGLETATANNGISSVEASFNLESNPLGQKIVNWSQTNESENMVYPSLVDLDDSYIVVEYVSNDDNRAAVNIVSVPKQSYKNFMTGFAVSYQPVFSWFSLYGADDLKDKQNSIF